MTPEETQLFQSLLSEVKHLRKEVAELSRDVTPISKALRYKATQAKSKETMKELEEQAMFSMLNRGRSKRLN